MDAPARPAYRRRRFRADRSGRRLEPRQRVHEPDVLVLHHEADLVAVRAASEAMEKPLGVDDGKRRRALVVVRADTKVVPETLRQLVES